MSLTQETTPPHGKTPIDPPRDKTLFDPLRGMTLFNPPSTQAPTRFCGSMAGNSCVSTPSNAFASFYCDMPRCLCRRLCPSGHYLLNRRNSGLACTYLPCIERHRYPTDGSVVNLYYCSGMCTGSRSGGNISLHFFNNEWCINPILEKTLA